MKKGKFLKFVLITAFFSALIFFLFSLGLFTSRESPEEGLIAQIDIKGIILSAADTIEEIKKYAEDDSVTAILVRIDSPGGGAAPSQEIYSELLKIREEGRKKIVASIGNIGASGGYYIASACDLIVANPGSITGSIGVIFQFSYIGDLLDKIGIGHEVIKSGPYKDIGSALRPIEPEERIILQGLIDDVHRQFIEAVARGRGMDFNEVVVLADGRIFTGLQAREAGLVDELGGLEKAVDEAARLAGIEGKPEVIKPKKKWKWRALLEDLQPSFLKKWSYRPTGGLMYLWLPSGG